jgi:NAD(P)-dependent dehydrogenase (short-subunit alcohol dehydrogenase family)
MKKSISIGFQNFRKFISIGFQKTNSGIYPSNTIFHARISINMNDSFSLKDKVIVVTGATGVLGEAFVKTLSDAGAKLALVGRNQEIAEKRVCDIKDSGGEAIAVIADVLDKKQLEAGLEKILNAYQRIDGLVNGAGGNIKEAVIDPSQDIFSIDIEATRKVFDLNLFGTILPVQVFGPAIAASGEGSIVNISSMASSQAITKVLGYSMAKAAIDNYTRWMSVEMANRYGEKIRMNAIAPGFFITHQNRAMLTNPDGSLTPRGQSVINNTPYKRFGDPKELCGALIWLLSGASSFVSGQTIYVDGGFSVFSGV